TDHHHDARVSFSHHESQSPNRLRDYRLGNTYPVLHIERSDVNVGTYVKCYVHLHLPGTRIVGADVGHSRGTVDLGLDWRGYCLLHGLSICSWIGHRHRHDRRRDVGILRHRQRQRRQYAHQHDHDGAHHRHHWAFYEYL